jgi:hypothetical protein
VVRLYVRADPQSHRSLRSTRAPSRSNAVSGPGSSNKGQTADSLGSCHTGEWMIAGARGLSLATEPVALAE